MPTFDFGMEEALARIQFANKDFSPETIDALSKKGIRILSSGIEYYQEEGRTVEIVIYVLNNNGVQQTRQFHEILYMAEEI